MLGRDGAGRCSNSTPTFAESGVGWQYRLKDLEQVCGVRAATGHHALNKPTSQDVQTPQT
eukprot:m.194808 g.194808  ORF g.194808 m.194808 type:complete len:60 (+) comp25021_c0_seq2:1612-1791(+)